MTIDELLQKLGTQPADASVVFTTEQGEIGGSFHVTELKLAKVTGIDCAARQAEWSEAIVQLLDGGGGRHMVVNKLRKILAQSIKQVKTLGQAELHVEFSHNNVGLQQYWMRAPQLVNGRVEIHLDAQQAVCKPIQVRSSVSRSSCCGA